MPAAQPTAAAMASSGRRRRRIARGGAARRTSAAAAAAVLLQLLPEAVPQLVSLQSDGEAENWRRMDSRVCEGSWAEEQWGFYDEPEECHAECKGHADCKAFAFCPDCYTTQCWLCLHDQSATSWQIAEEEGVDLYTPASVCPAGSAAETTVTDPDECRFCPAGYFSPLFSTVCFPCPVGSHAASHNSTSCADCPSTHMDVCGVNGGCAADGSDLGFSIVRIRTNGCRCKDGFTGLVCDEVDRDDMSRRVALTVLAVVGALCVCYTFMRRCVQGVKEHDLSHDVEMRTHQKRDTSKSYVQRP